MSSCVLGWELTACCFHSLIEGRASEQFPLFYSFIYFIGRSLPSPISGFRASFAVKYSWLVGSALLSVVGTHHLTLLTQRLLKRNLLAVVWGFLLHTMSLFFLGGGCFQNSLSLISFNMFILCLHENLISVCTAYSVCCVHSSPPQALIFFFSSKLASYLFFCSVPST